MERRNRRMLTQDRAHDVPLNALTLAVNQPHFGQAGLFTLFEILLHDAGNIAGLKRVKIEMIFDGHDHRIDKRNFPLAHFDMDSATALAPI